MIAARLLRRVTRLSPYVRELEQHRASLGEFPEGKFGSALATKEEVDAHYQYREQSPPELSDIDFNKDGQFDFLKSCVAVAEQQPFSDEPSDGLRYHFT